MQENKKAAPGVRSTQSGNVKCDNISDQSVEQNNADVKGLDMVRELLWLKDAVEERYASGAVYACNAYTSDDAGGAQANISFSFNGELYNLNLRHEI